MEKIVKRIEMSTEEILYFAGIKIVLRRKDCDNEKNMFTIKVGDNMGVAFYNRRTDWNNILGDFWEFVKNYDRDKIVLAHCEDLWRTDDRKELDRVYVSYSILSESIMRAFDGDICLALEFADDYTAGM